MCIRGQRGKASSLELIRIGVAAGVALVRASALRLLTAAPVPTGGDRHHPTSEEDLGGRYGGTECLGALRRDFRRR